MAVTVDVSGMAIPPEVDLTEKQVLKLTLVAVRKTLEAYHGSQIGGLKVSFVIAGAEGVRAALKEMDGKFTIEGADLSR